MSESKPPSSLAKSGGELWTSIVAKYDLRADELRTLEDACAAVDMVAALTSVWEGEGRPVTTKGSMGQQVIHPLIGEIRTQRAAVNKLLQSLKLPDEPGGVKPNQQRDAANSRWAAAHGASA